MHSCAGNPAWLSQNFRFECSWDGDYMIVCSHFSGRRPVGFFVGTGPPPHRPGVNFSRAVAGQETPPPNQSAATAVLRHHAVHQSQHVGGTPDVTGLADTPKM